MKKKYYFFKKLYKDYVIIIDCNGIKKSLRYDKLLIKYINNKDINYIIIYNDFEIEKVNFKLNNYKKYLIIEFLISIIKM